MLTIDIPRARLLRRLGLVAATSVVTGLVACGEDPILVCTMELKPGIASAPATVRVGETATIRAQATSCGGTVIVPMTWRYSVEDSVVARIDSMSGLLTAKAAGATRVRAAGRFPASADTFAVYVAYHLITIMP